MICLSFTRCGQDDEGLHELSEAMKDLPVDFLSADIEVDHKGEILLCLISE